MDARVNSRRALGYVRQSSDKQDRNLSLGAQKRSEQEYCNGKELHLLDIYEDVGTALDTKDRPEFLRMINRALDPSNNIGHLVFYDLSRYSRDKAEFYQYQNLLADNGITIHSTIEGDNSDENTELLFDMKNIFNNLYSKTVSKLTIRGQEEAVRNGYNIIRVVAVGYEKYYITDSYGKVHAKIRPNPKTAPYILKAFEMRAEGHRAGRIQKYLNDEVGLPSPKGGLWSQTTINSILRNRVYDGVVVYRNTPSSKFALTRRNTTPLVVENAHEAIVPHELFVRVQKLMDQDAKPRTGSPRSVGSPNILSERIKCGKCRDNGYDSNMIISTPKKGHHTVHLSCARKKNAGIKHCSKADVPMDLLLNIIIANMIENILTEETISDQISRIEKSSHEFVSNEKSRQASIRMQIRKIDSGKSNLMDTLKQWGNQFPESASEIMEEINNLSIKRQELEAEEHQLDEETAEYVAFITDPQGVIKAARNVRTYLDSEQRPTAREFLRELIQAVYVYDDDDHGQSHGLIEYSLPLPGTGPGERTSNNRQIRIGNEPVLMEQYSPLCF